ncbi:MAG: glycosyltransferase family 39 protein [Elusimicrobia bacterium]|nr:glycosyltransferase family 39 protein [Elusimicrobiota bacterium]MDE2237124.1 glycosyltransferase family 39 protein [Elusimicrobiota bacterium]MDE2425546.1 glycosyltransferase family 39 protein [Elusimicrobiota bacterium]
MSGRKALLLILVAGLALRLGYALRTAQKTSSLPDPDDYCGLALSFARDGSLSLDGRLTAHREPAYPIALGLAFLALGATLKAGLALNLLASMLSLLLIYDLGRRLFDERSALAAAAIAALYPPFIFYAAQLRRETWMVFVTLLGLWALCSAQQAGRARGFALAGLANALGPLSNIVFLPFGLLVAPALAWWSHRRQKRPAAALTAAYLACFLALCGLWPLRNRIELGRFYLGGSGGGWANLYDYLVVPENLGGTPRQTALLAADPVVKKGDSLDPIARDRWYFEAGLRFIKRHPARYARLLLWRCLDFWRPWPRPRPYPLPYWLLKAIGLFSDAWIIPLGWLAILCLRAWTPERLWLLGFGTSVSAVYIAVFTMNRYRLPVMPMLILFAAAALVRAVEALRRAI